MSKTGDEIGGRVWQRVRALLIFALLATALPWVGSRLFASPTPAPPPFRWSVFLIYALIILACAGPLVRRIAKWRPASMRSRAARRSFPWWGWTGLVIATGAWILAWTRFTWFAPWQQDTFTPLWLGYILVINALAFRDGGRCLLRDRPGCFAALFPASAAFWWYFEYIDGYVNNWHYVGVASPGGLDYFARATISFSTVLPAFVGTREWLASFPRLQHGLTGLPPLPRADAKTIVWVLFGLGAVGFAAIGAWPRYLYPMVWVGPVLVLTALQALAAAPNPLTPMKHGDWRHVGVPALAALVCGFFWEMWNWQSLAHWEYTVPFVQRFPVFEMPLLGYAGYLPFGIACAAIADLVCGEATGARASSFGPD